MIKISNLSKAYKKNVVFENFSFQIEDNLVLLIGPNGSGKTTILNCINNHIKYCGDIQISGKISYLPEERGFEQDVIAKDLLNLFCKGYKTNVDKYLNQLEFAPQIDKPIAELSKGNLTKLFILCTLAKPCDIYIFDEPTDGLDKNSRENFILICKELSKTKSVIVSSHDLGFIDRMVNQAQVLNLEDKNVFKN